MDLSIIGWDSTFEQQSKTYEGQVYVPGRVTLEHKHVYRVITENGEVLAEVAGKMRYGATARSDFPVVGDWVMMSIRPGGDWATIHAVLPRRSKFSRKVAGSAAEEQIVAANIDTVFLVSALNNEFNSRRIERYLTMAWESGAVPVVVLNKADLCDDVKRCVREAELVAPGVPVHAISCTGNEGLGELLIYLSKPGHTAALLGSSGVGKSSIINRLMGKEIQQISGVRTGDDRGRHTTTHRELIFLPSGGMIIDTPGMRELQLWGTGEGFKGTFDDIEKLASKCRFSDCQHENEPHCAVKKALQMGTLERSRLENYRKLQKELSFLASRDNLEERLARKEKEKKLGKMIKRINNR